MPKDEKRVPTNSINKKIHIQQYNIKDFFLNTFKGKTNFPNFTHHFNKVEVLLDHHKHPTNFNCCITNKYNVKTIFFKTFT